MFLQSTEFGLALDHMDRDDLQKTSRKIPIIFYIFLGGVLLLVGIGYIFINYQRSHSNTLPLPISKLSASELKFNIYYPKQNLLPRGYSLDLGSFVVSNQALIYSVNYLGNNKIVFSEQPRPTDLQIQDFYTKDMPLHTIFSTPNGTATLGAINARTVVSLPTNTNGWLIITAPGNVDQSALKQVVNSLRLARQ